MEFSVGKPVTILYQGEENKEGPKVYKGIIDRISYPKTTNKLLLTIDLGNGKFKSFYPDKALSISSK